MLRPLLPRMQSICLKSLCSLIFLFSIPYGSVVSFAAIRKASNHAPVLDPIGNKTAKSYETLTFTVSATDPDEGQTLTYSVSPVNWPNSIEINSSTGEVIFTPLLGFYETQPATVNFTIRVTDDGDPQLYDEQEVTVVVYPIVMNIMTSTFGNGSGHIDVNPPSPSAYVMPVTATAVPDPGSVFTGWGGNYASRGLSTSIMFFGPDYGTLGTNINLSAGFELSVTPVLDPIGNKSISLPKELTFNVTATNQFAAQVMIYSLIDAPQGASISNGIFRWTPADLGSYTFKIRVEDEGSPNLFDEEEITVFVTEGQKYSLTTSVTGGGSVSKNPERETYYETSSVELTAVPAPDYKFAGWSGDVVETSNPLVVEMSSNKSITANFVFCGTGSGQVTLIAGNAGVCTGTTVDLVNMVTSVVPSTASLLFFNTNDHSGEPVTNPDEATEGTYYAFFYNKSTDCYNTEISAASITVNTIDCSVLADLKTYLTMDQVAFTSAKNTNPFVLRIRNIKKETIATSPIVLRLYKPTSASTVSLTGQNASDWNLVAENENYYEFSTDVDVPYTPSGGYELTANLTLPTGPVKGAFNFRVLLVTGSGGEAASDNGNNNVVIGVSKL